MKRLVFAAALMVGVSSLASGCRSCQSPYDYGPPVADCNCAGCNACGAGRAGSVLSHGYTTESVYETTPVEMATTEADSMSVVPGGDANLPIENMPE